MPNLPRPILILLILLVVIVGWSRVELRDHTRNQVIAGTILGTIE
jgi:membrane-associated phospholipid phosphatase